MPNPVGAQHHPPDYSFHTLNRPNCPLPVIPCPRHIFLFTFSFPPNFFFYSVPVFLSFQNSTERQHIIKTGEGRQWRQEKQICAMLTLPFRVCLDCCLSALPSFSCETTSCSVSCWSFSREYLFVSTSLSCH